MEPLNFFSDLPGNIWIPFYESNRTDEHGNIIAFLNYEDAKAAFEDVGPCIVISIKLDALKNSIMQTYVATYTCNKKTYEIKREFRSFINEEREPLSWPTIKKVIYERLLIKP